MAQRIQKLLSILLLGVIIAGCAAPTTRQSGLDPELIRQEEERQKDLAVSRDRDYNDRLQRVAWPILAKAAPLCEKNTASRLGLYYSNIEAYHKDYKGAARRIYRLDDRLRITSVTLGSPAQLAGIKSGDVLLTINGVETPVGKKAVAKFAKQLNDALKEETGVSFTLLRGSQPLELYVEPQEVCRFSAHLVSTDALNAYADGNAIYVTRGMMRFADDDQELSVVIAHELAHNSQEHIKAKMKNYWLGAIFDIAAAAAGANTQGAFANAAARAYSKEFEAEADYVGMYAMALAGMDLSGAANFWREMGADNPGAISKAYATTHPSTAERFLAIENAAIEIQTKRQHGISLKPEKKE